MDSAGTLYPNASAVNNLVSGLTTSVAASAMVNLVSGLVTGVNASSLNNLVSGLTTGVAASALNYAISGISVSAGQLNYATGYPASCAYAASATTAQGAASASYAASAGTLSGVTSTPAMINAMLYASARYKVAFGSALATDVVVMTSVTNLGMSTALFAQVTPHSTGIIAGAVATQTGIQWMIATHAGTATQAVVDYLVIGTP